MTLDEARDCLSLARGASIEEVQEAFRSRARDVHPDRHPHASPAQRTALSEEFDRARRARDALVQWTRYAETPGGTSWATTFTDAASAPSAPRRDAPREPAQEPPAEPAPEPPPRPRARPRTSESRRPAPEPERVTMRFDEFVVWSDAAGFNVGQRSRRYIDWARIIVWSALGVVIAAMVAAMTLASMGVLRA